MKDDVTAIDDSNDEYNVSMRTVRGRRHAKGRGRSGTASSRAAAARKVISDDDDDDFSSFVTSTQKIAKGKASHQRSVVGSASQQTRSRARERDQSPDMEDDEDDVIQSSFGLSSPSRSRSQEPVKNTETV